ncbi:N,N-dimethylformamidase beta subunit family domain-containing protein [Amycolatopsis sp.]|uniref:N,N-dimethylformamidase beta subunit family domain-containing protein n=1 Tax=Amycolatopsis sp. TaxID=37632 RepID=UPI002BB7EF97|nr:N,N-dimethylformamidase beta subunit family domain-containing protein [Amycolatopsis sp.]HVV11188.1 N,N-dimethylformamidase beta subunit family domain-containing protein [Amycolatopsis sp.]
MEDYLVGYTDRFSVRPGQSLACMVSTTSARYVAEIVGPLPRPGAPDVWTYDDLTAVEGVSKIEGAGRQQHTQGGSFAHVAGLGNDLRELRRLRVSLWCQPTLLPARSDQVVLGNIDPESHTGWELTLTTTSYAAVRAVGTARAVEVSVPLKDDAARWYHLEFDYDSTSRQLILTLIGPGRSEPISASVVCEPDFLRQCADDLVVAARRTSDRDSDVRVSANFTGKIDSLHVYGLDSKAADCQDLLLSHWRFGETLTTEWVADTGPMSRDARLVNFPTRAVRGHLWDGSCTRFADAPEQYSAVYFHADDLGGAGWDRDLEIQIPADLRTGVYGVRCTNESAGDLLPFVVLPGSDDRRPATVVVLPWLTYLAYGNSRKGFAQEFLDSAGLEPIADLVPEVMLQHPEWGKSLYDVHEDGSGVVYASWQRPLLDVRPYYRNWLTGGPRNFSSDMYILWWLDHLGVPVDVITDRELDADGAAALVDYEVVLTGSHPEYVTQGMLDALCHYTETGGNLMYLGGNGFYWVTSIHPSRADVIEVRRGYAGTRAWTSHPGETYHATTGEQGGLWRHRGRPPNELVGVGFSAQGWDKKAAFYRRTAISFDPAYDWVFRDVDDERIGDFGLVMDGAGGDEIDRYDAMLGGADAAVLASACGNSDRYCLAVEDVMESTTEITASTNEKVRADMVLMRTSGGSVFSVGSMGWVPALPVNGFKNNVATVTENVLRAFLDNQGGAGTTSAARDTTIRRKRS